MKKVLIALLIVAAAGSLSAEVTVGAQIDMAIVPFQFVINEGADEANEKNKGTSFMYAAEQEETVMGAGAGRFASGQGPRARLDLKASYEDEIGMRARIQARTDGIGIEDYLQAWWKPTEWLRVDAGRFFDDRLRGKINDLDERMSAHNVRMYDGDAIFSRFRTHRNGGQAGLMLSFFLTDGFLSDVEDEFSVGLLLYDLLPFGASPAAGAIFDAHPDYVANNADAYHNVQGAIAWTINDVLQFRAQYLGAKPQVVVTRVTDETATTPFTYNFYVFSITGPRIEAAFAFTGVDGLTIDVGGKMPLPFRDWDRPPSNVFEKENEDLLTDTLYRIYKNNYIWQAPYQVSLGLNYTIGNFGIGGRVDAKFGGSVKGTKTEMYFGPEVNCHIWPSYDLGFAKIIADFGFEYIGETVDHEGKIVQDGEPLALNGGNRMGAGLSLQKTFSSNCVLKGGVAWKQGGKVNGIQENTVISVPLFLDWYF